MADPSKPDVPDAPPAPNASDLRQPGSADKPSVDKPSVDRPGNRLDEQIHLTAVDEFLAWGKENSLFYLLFATACCGIELMQAGGPPHDVEPLGIIPRATPPPGHRHILAAP